MTSWNYTIYRSTFDITNKKLLRVIAFDPDSGTNGVINYFIGTADVPYFSINLITGAITFASNIHGLASLNISRFPITFSVYARDLGTPSLFSKNTATVTIYFDSSDKLPEARWLDTRYEELNILISEKFYETYPNKPIFDTSQDFNGSIMYELTSETSSVMTVTNVFSNDKYMPFRTIPVVRDGRIFTSGIIVTR